VVETIEEGIFIPPIDPPLAGTFPSPLVELPSTIYFDSFSSYFLPLDTFHEKYLGMDTTPLDFSQELVASSPLSTSPLVELAITTLPQTTTRASTLWGTSLG